MEQQQRQQPQGWRDVQITTELSVEALVHFLNVLNQRICVLEDIVQCEDPDGKIISITELYQLQNQQQGE